MPHGRGCALAVALAALLHSAAHASPLSVEVTSDDRRRGISWSEGRASVSADLRIPLVGGLEADARLSALRGSARFGAADAGLATGLRHVTRAGPWTFEAGAVANLFIAQSRFDHVELQASAAHQLGPVQARLSAAYSPPQDALGGDNLYLSGDLDSAIPGTPYTLYAGAGRTTGDFDAGRASGILRPSGSYWDHRIGIERVDGPLVLGLRYSDTDMDDVRAAHSGARIVFYLNLGL